MSFKCDLNKNTHLSFNLTVVNSSPWGVFSPSVSLQQLQHSTSFDVQIESYSRTPSVPPFHWTVIYQEYMQVGTWGCAKILWLSGIWENTSTTTILWTNKPNQTNQTVRSVFENFSKMILSMSPKRSCQGKKFYLFRKMVKNAKWWSKYN